VLIKARGASDYVSAHLSVHTGIKAAKAATSRKRSEAAICNQEVGGSNPLASTIFSARLRKWCRAIEREK